MAEAQENTWCEATWAAALDVSKAFDMVWHAGLYKLKYYGLSG